MGLLNKIFGGAKCAHIGSSKYTIRFDPDRVGGGPNAERQTSDKPRPTKTLCDNCYLEELKLLWPESPKSPIVMAEFENEGDTRLAFVPRSALASFDCGKWKDLGDAQWKLPANEPCGECQKPANSIWLSPDATTRGYSSNASVPVKSMKPIYVCGECAADRIVNAVRDHEMMEFAANAPNEEGGVLVPFA